MVTMDHDPVRTYGDGLALVTVTRAGRPAVDGLLASLPAATSRPVHVVVADTASASAPAVPSGVEVLRLTEDVGRAAAVNRAVVALDAAIGWVLVADPWVRWSPGAVDVLLAAAARHPRAGLLGPLLRDRRGLAVPSGGPLPTLLAALRGRVPTGVPAGPTGWLSTGAALLRRSAWDTVDGLDARYLGARYPGGRADPGDVDLGDRLGRAGWLVVGVPEAEAAFAVSDAHGILEPPADGLRRYVQDRAHAPVRALTALAQRQRKRRGRAR
jgi:N-acetylglucosaminyl-diphospho-decaprenol L-rhamnosyltransferase